MGIFKNIKDYVTGGAAEVSLMIQKTVLNQREPLRLLIKVKPTGETIHPKRVYLQIMALEQSSTRNTLYNKEYVLEENIQINQGECKEWTHVVELPEEVPATVIAKHFRVEWGVKASLDMSGTDPSSGWQPFVLNKAMTFDVEQ
ncbi:MAG: sporulation protein [Marinoscillum sp.]